MRITGLSINIDDLAKSPRACHCEHLTPALRFGVGHEKNFYRESQYNLSLRAKRSNLAPVPAREIATACGLAMTEPWCYYPFSGLVCIKFLRRPQAAAISALPARVQHYSKFPGDCCDS